jgi:hypothetical protein
MIDTQIPKKRPDVILQFVIDGRYLRGDFNKPEKVPLEKAHAIPGGVEEANSIIRAKSLLGYEICIRVKDFRGARIVKRLPPIN